KDPRAGRGRGAGAQTAGGLNPSSQRGGTQHMIQVSVPATSANVGAGFDSLGLAVSLHNVFTFEEAEGIQISSVDGTHVPAGSNNLVYRSARVVYDQLGIPLRGLRITQRNDIPDRKSTR